MSDKCRILVVDSLQDAAESLVYLLELWGYESRAAYSAHDAMKILIEFDPNVVILEIAIPIIDGYKLAEMMWRHKPKIKIAALTGYATQRYVEMSKKTGFRHHLLKPIEPDEFARIVQHDLCQLDECQS